ncbi:IMPACT family protein [Bifidobacterium eulemuris]|uniref:IMPACT family member YigZ n=1 Tax=Bifidobacterium eulemuris TaxID=1765219 RepID=A0A261G3D1_9BIFI|nr:YigZ family protein [Bifidobacterium eulemuris]OZG65898.1 IMPACT family member YigZ [Bifidobacterium eulemuris]QOL31967.1 YigZ family protein [Bifidobacterium eulemuris]
MRTILNPADQPAHASLVEKKSEFIGDAAHIDSLEEALAFVETIREQHPKARHVAYAAVTGGADGRLSERMSDDGEPSGTAGKPILDVLRQSGSTDCVVAVTRYFGGILLGSGGLVRAYSSAASLAMKAATAASIVPCQRYRLRLEYPQLARLQQLLAQSDGTQDQETYTDRVELVVAVPVENAARFEDRVREAFNAALTPEPLDCVNRAVPDAGSGADAGQVGV